MPIPSYIDHNNGVDLDPYDKRRDYLSRYLESKGMGNETYRGFKVSATQASLAFVAFKLVEARFKLSDTLQSTVTDNTQKIEALEAEVFGWDIKAERALSKPGALASDFIDMVSDFTIMATEARQPDDEEREHMSLGLQGRVDEIKLPECPPQAYDYSAY